MTAQLPPDRMAMLKEAYAQAPEAVIEALHRVAMAADNEAQLDALDRIRAELGGPMTIDSGWCDYPYFDRPLQAKLDMEGVLTFSEKITHAEHEATLRSMRFATAACGLPYSLAPGSCEECG